MALWVAGGKEPYAYLGGDFKTTIFSPLFGVGMEYWSTFTINLSQRYILNDGSPFCIIWDAENLPKTIPNNIQWDTCASSPPGCSTRCSHESRAWYHKLPLSSRLEAVEMWEPLDPRNTPSLNRDPFFLKMFGLVVLRSSNRESWNGTHFWWGIKLHADVAGYFEGFPRIIVQAGWVAVIKWPLYTEQMAAGKVVLPLSSYALPKTHGRQGFRISETEDILGQKYEFPACDHKCPWKYSCFFGPGVFDWLSRFVHINFQVGWKKFFFSAKLWCLTVSKKMSQPKIFAKNE